jgi:hypothetical protein
VSEEFRGDECFKGRACRRAHSRQVFFSERLNRRAEQDHAEILAALDAAGTSDGTPVQRINQLRYSLDATKGALDTAATSRDLADAEVSALRDLLARAQRDNTYTRELEIRLDELRQLVRR